MTRKEWKAAHRAARIARQKRDAPSFSFARKPTVRTADPLEGLEADLRRLVSAGAAQAAELPVLALSFPLRRVLALVALVTVLIVGLTLARGAPADAGVTDVNASQARPALPATSPS